MDSKEVTSGQMGMANCFPYEITAIEPQINSQLLKYFHGERTGFVQVGPQKYFFPLKYKDAANDMYKFQARPDDVWVATFPRSGTTWTQELVWLIANDCNFDVASSIPLSERFPFFEFSVFMHDDVKMELIKLNGNDLDKQKFIEKLSIPGYELLRNIPSRRFIKTHLPFSLLPPSIMEKKSKVIYVARNPKDVAVSYYYLNRLYKTQGFVGDFQTYWNFFKNNLNPWTPYWSHIKEGLSHRHASNVLFMSYEEMKQNLPNTIRKVAKFLNEPVGTTEISKLDDYLNIENFRNNPAVNGHEMRCAKVLNPSEASFIRNGTIGSHHTEFTQELLDEADGWIAENMKDIDANLFSQVLQS